MFLLLYVVHLNLNGNVVIAWSLMKGVAVVDVVDRRETYQQWDIHGRCGGVLRIVVPICIAREGLRYFECCVRVSP